MISTSTTATVPFSPIWHCDESREPKPGAPVFHLRAGGVIERGQLEAELSGRYRAGRVYDFELRNAVREGVVALLADDPELDRVLGLIEAEAEAEREAVETGAKPAGLDKEDAQLFAQIRAILAEAWPPYADLVAQRERRNELAPLLAFRRFCTGWDNIKADCTRGRDGLLTEAALRGPDPLDLVAAGNRAYALLYVDAETAGNSARPGSSAKDPTTSPTVGTLTADGTSPADAG